MNRNGLTRELLAEFFGTMVLCLGGDGVVANVGLAPRLAAQGYDWNTITWGWGLSVMVAVYVGGGVTGAHINPAVTLAMAVKRGFEWAKVIPYFIAQVAGGFVGALGVYLAYQQGLDAAGMPNVWATGPGSIFEGAFWGHTIDLTGEPYPLWNAFITEIIGTMVLLLGVVSFFDNRNWGKSTLFFGPLAVGLVVVMVGLTLGGPSGYAINPARDFGPRLFGTIVGTDGLWDDFYWLIAPIIGPLIGGPLGVILYDIFITPGLPEEE
jgi:glycerol uptake facilitator protein